MRTISVSLDQVAPGLRCYDAIRDVQGHVLVSRGHRLTKTMLRGLADRGINIVNVSPEDLSNFTQRLAGAPVLGHAIPTLKEGATHSSRRRLRCCEAYSSERAERFGRQLHDSLAVVDEIGERIHNLSKPALAELCRLPDMLSNMLVEDTDQTISAFSMRLDEVTLAHRTALMSTLAMALGIEMGLPDSDVFLLGNAGLLHDLSLFDLPPHFWDPSQPLSQRELVDYQRHPQRTLEFLGDHPYVSAGTRELILQVHELGDGTGFPGRIKSTSCHRLTKVLNCVEVYLALVSPAPGRNAIVPHDALSLMLYQCYKGTLDTQVMRAFINQVALFPIGSSVRLDNGQQAQVIRRYENEYHAPVVLPDGQSPEDILFLSDSDLSIAAPIPTPLQTRIPKNFMPNLELSSLISRSVPHSPFLTAKAASGHMRSGSALGKGT